MTVIYPKNSVIKITKIPNFLLLNRFSFGLIKLFLITKSNAFLKIKYKHIKPVFKLIKNYKDFEVVNITSQKGDNVRILL